MACCKSPSAVNNNTKSMCCDLANITNTHFLIHLSIQIKTFQSLTPFTQLKVLGKPYARSLRPSLNLIIYTTHLQKSLKALCVFILRSRLDETTGVPLIPAIDNIFHCQLHSGGSLGESQNL